MNKTVVYRWRLDPDLERRLESTTRAEKTSVGGLLDRIRREWLGGEALQRQLRAWIMKFVGTISSGDPMFRAG